MLFEAHGQYLSNPYTRKEEYLCEAELVHWLANAFFTVFHRGRAFGSMKNRSLRILQHYTALKEIRRGALEIGGQCWLQDNITLNNVWT